MNQNLSGFTDLITKNNVMNENYEKVTLFRNEIKLNLVGRFSLYY